MSNQCCPCGSFALNDYPESGLCDSCYWADQACVFLRQLHAVRAERNQLRWLIANRDKLPTVCLNCSDPDGDPDGDVPLWWDGEQLYCPLCGFNVPLKGE